MQMVGIGAAALVGVGAGLGVAYAVRGQKKQRTTTQKRASARRGSRNPPVKAKDRETFDAVVDGLKLYLERWSHPGETVAYVRLDKSAERTVGSTRTVYSIARRYPSELAHALGWNSGEYEGSSYAASGCGAFGRLGGGRRAHYNEPTLRLRRSA